VPSFSGIFKPIGNVFKGLSSKKFASILEKVVLPVAGVAIGIKQAASQSLPPAPAVQPDSAAPDTSGAQGAATKKAWYTNPVVYLGGAAVVLLGALVLSRKGS